MMTEFCVKHGAPHAPNDCAECDGGERAMRSAKEWAADAVTDSGWVHDKDARVALCQPSRTPAARGIIERLVEHAQADARAPLEEEIARLKTRNDYVEGMTGAYESVIAGVVERLSKSLEPGADTAAYVREVAAHLKGLVTL